MSVRIGSALFNANHGQLSEELRRAEAAGIDFVHWDVFDGHFVPDLAFPPRTIQTLRPHSKLPFEVHLAVNDPLRFLPALKHAGADLVFLPAESTTLLYEAIFAVREQGMQVGLCLALGTPLIVLEPVLPLLDAVLLLGRVTGEGQRGRTFNTMLLPRIRAVRAMIDAAGKPVDLQAAGGLEVANCAEAVAAGATSLPLGAALHRERDIAAFVQHLRQNLATKGTEDTEKQQTNLPAVFSVPYVANKVLVASRSFGPNCPETVERMRATGCELIPNTWGRAPTEDELLALVGNVDAIISGTEPLTERVFAAAPKLKIVAKHGVGYENIDLEAAKRRSIPVALAGGAIADSVADMAFALILALARQIPQGDRAVRAGTWPRMVGVELRGKTLGIIGLGQIGKELAKRAKGFGMQIAAFDLYPDQAFAANWGVRFAPLDELLTKADIVSLHAPVTAETRNMINAESLACMKPSALLVNTARGELVDETALFDALRSGTIAGAASDVFVHEPPGQHPLLTLENFVAAPHSASQTVDGLRKMGEITGENVLLALMGQDPRFRVA